MLRHYAKRFLSWLALSHANYPPVIDLKRVLMDAQRKEGK